MVFIYLYKNNVISHLQAGTKFKFANSVDSDEARVFFFFFFFLFSHFIQIFQLVHTYIQQIPIDSITKS